MKRYRANFTNGSLMIPESRIIAGVLLDRPDEAAWHESVVDRNVLQKRTVNSASTLANLIRRRLETMPGALWELVAAGPPDTVRQSLLAATVKHSPLLGDFMLLVLRDLFRGFEERIPPLAWEKYLEDRWSQYASAPRWSDATVAKLKQNGFRILTEAGCLTDTRSLALRKVFIVPDVRACLEKHGEDYALSCLLVCA